MHRLPLSLIVPLTLLLGAPALAEPTVTMPEVSHGANPYRSYVGVIDGAGTLTLLPIPADQDFIITLLYTPSDDLTVLRDGEVILKLPAIYKTHLRKGNARLRVEGGATLSLRREATWSTSKYYLQGYLTQAGGPRRFVNGITPGGGTHVVWTSDPERDFIAQSMKVNTSNCDFGLAGEPISFGSFPYDGGAEIGLSVGHGSLVIPAGQSLSVTHSMAGEPCEYFIEGTYIQP